MSYYYVIGVLAVVLAAAAVIFVLARRCAGYRDDVKILGRVLADIAASRR